VTPLTTARSRSLVRSLSLRAPIATEEERTQFQRRLSLTLGVVFALSAAFWTIQMVIFGVLHPTMLHHVVDDESTQVHFVTTAVCGVGWLLLRRGHRSARFLDVADLIATTVVCLGWIAMIVVQMPWKGPRMELVSLLAVTYTLTSRAALVPSTPARSAVLAVVGTMPLVPVTYLMSDASERSALSPLDAAIFVFIWGVIGVANVTVISWVIYGLRLEMRKAMRLGQYILDDKIGEGGMGVVYRAHHAMLRRETAIKLLTGTTGQAAARFEREVQITARLTHPNTIAVFDYGRTPDGVFYYAMEFLEGISLEDLVERHGPQPPARVVHLLLQMCGALEEAHSAGLVHRDIKPANVMLTMRGGMQDVVKVLDFGLVKEITNADPALSAVNTIVGTPHYMSPEAIVQPESIDARADLYGVGATGFYLLTGERVFDGASLVEICSKHLHETPDPPSRRKPGLPAALDAVILACLEKKPEARPASAEALADLLRAAALPEWTRQDARAWWDAAPAPVAHASRSPSSVTKPRADTDAALGKTIAVALEGRR
jgi:eukaryotic-like serine/threonine-protein kinase